MGRPVHTADTRALCSLLFQAGRKGLVDDFVRLVFSVYSMRRASDQRLFEVFLFEMLKMHIVNADTPEDVLTTGGLERLSSMCVRSHTAIVPQTASSSRWFSRRCLRATARSALRPACMSAQRPF